ncbi:MAG: hypothetical protein K2O18_19000, partial [Oscillospiraceae bacterium]|nr:hypothetical protein [Oscillospiraceae bacterium]
MYQQEITAKDAVQALKKEYGTSGHSHTFLDGTGGFVDYSPSAGMKMRRYQPNAEIKVTWARVEKRIRQMVQEGSYLTPEELEKYRSDHLEQVPDSQGKPPVPEQSPAIRITQDEIDAMLRDELLTKRQLDIYAIYHRNLTVEETVEAVKSVFGRAAVGYTRPGGMSSWTEYEPDIGITIKHSKTGKELEKVTLTWPDVEKRLRQLISAGRYLTPEELEKYQSDYLEQVTIEHHQEQTPPAPVPETTPPVPAPAPAREVTQADIDEAIQEWNGDIASKRRVQQYMTGHAREKGTAEWLKNEYGDNFPAYPIPGHEGRAGTDLPWTKVQRHLARLVKEDRFFTEEEHDDFEDIDPAAIREHLEQVKDQPSAFVERVMSDVEQIAEQETNVPVTAPPAIREIYGHYKPIVKELVLADTAYQNACKNSDRENAVIEGDAAVKRAALTITEPEFMRLYHDMPDFRYRLHREIVDETYTSLTRPQQEQAILPDLSDRPIIREGDTITIGSGDATHEVDITVSDEEWQTIQEVIGAADRPPHDPLAPAYKVGDTVYLNNTAFEITGIGLLDVELRDPAMFYPIFRTESKENFERLLHQDTRNGRITSYLSADMSRINDDFREVLTSHLLTDRDKGYISSWLRSGENNRGIAMRLSEAFASRAETVTLETGDIADYFTSTIDMAVEIQDKFGTKLSLSWDAIAPILRAMYQQELDGFTHEPVQREPVELEGQLSYQVGDKVAFSYGDHDVSGTIEGIGEVDILIHTGPYAWSHETVTKDFFEDAVRHDERNASLFTPEEPVPPAPAQADEPAAPPPVSDTVVTQKPVTVYPGDKNGLPYDVVIQTLHIDGPEHDQPEQAPAAENFRITDIHLGEGGPKA